MHRREIRRPGDRARECRSTVFGSRSYSWLQLDQVLNEPSLLRYLVVEAARSLVARLRVPVDLGAALRPGPAIVKDDRQLWSLRGQAASPPRLTDLSSAFDVSNCAVWTVERDDKVVLVTRDRGLPPNEGGWLGRRSVSHSAGLVVGRHCSPARGCPLREYVPCGDAGGMAIHGVAASMETGSPADRDQDCSASDELTGA